MFDGIIFDVDGTLWDSTPVVEKAWNQALIDEGFGNISVTDDRLKGLFGLPMPEIIDAIMPGVPLKQQEAFAPKCYKYEHAYLEKEPGRLYPGILDTIRELAKGHDIFIVSNCQAGYIELFIEKTGIGDVIKDHVCLGDNDLLKADNIKLIVNKYNLKNPVYVGDIQGDANASREAGVAFIHAAYGFGKVDECYASVSEPAELIKVINDN
ncbi:MAG: HAD family hydrolase [Lachnospiraceae bacterium]|nr:HAD family hydrolase [Lachnospiraceae bacterium]